MGGFDKLDNDVNDDYILGSETAQINKPVSVREIIIRASNLKAEISRQKKRLSWFPDDEILKKSYDEAISQHALYIEKIYVSI